MSAFPKYHELDAVLVLVSIAFIAVLAIGAWIGWTMATTPPPKPIEEITTEMEEKKEEPKAEESASKLSTTKQLLKERVKLSKFSYFNFYFFLITFSGWTSFDFY